MYISVLVLEGLKNNKEKCCEYEIGVYILEELGDVVNIIKM